MNLVLAIAVATLFGCGAYLLVRHDLVRIVAGMVLISNAANLFIMSAGLSRGTAPIYPLPTGGIVADPLVQAMTLTAIVITFGISALLLSLIYRVYVTHDTLDTDILADVEERDEITAERDAGADDPEDDADILAREALRR